MLPFGFLAPFDESNDEEHQAHCRSQEEFKDNHVGDFEFLVARRKNHITKGAESTDQEVESGVQEKEDEVACVSESNAVPYPHTVMIILSVSSFPDTHFQNAFAANRTVLTALVDVGVTQSAMPPPLFHAIG